MNCKPGDLAVIVRMPGPKTQCLVGRIIRVTTLAPDEGEPAWAYEGPSLMETEWGVIGYVEDEFLRPIRPDGVSTEEVAALFQPAPAKTTEAA